MLATLDGFITDLAITPANIYGRAATWDLVSAYQNIILFGDKVYDDIAFAEALETEKNIKLLPFRKKQQRSII